MKCNIIRVGNSRGIRIPKTLLDQVGLKDTAELLVEGNRLVIQRSKSPREGWADAFREMARRGDDALLEGARWGQTKWDEDEWEW